MPRLPVPPPVTPPVAAPVAQPVPAVPPVPIAIMSPANGIQFETLRVMVVGRATPGSIVTLYVNGRAFRNTECDAEGGWCFGPTADHPLGTNVLSVAQQTTPYALRQTSESVTVQVVEPPPLVQIPGWLPLALYRIGNQAFATLAEAVSHAQAATANTNLKMDIKRYMLQHLSGDVALNKAGGQGPFKNTIFDAVAGDLYAKVYLGHVIGATNEAAKALTEGDRRCPTCGHGPRANFGWLQGLCFSPSNLRNTCAAARVTMCPATAGHIEHIYAHTVVAPAGVPAARPACRNCAQCGEHCACVRCGSCERTVPAALCTTCNVCETCCTRCRSCSRHEAGDGRCDACRGCVNCCQNCATSHSSIRCASSTQPVPPTFHVPTLSQLKENPLSRVISCEIEVAQSRSALGRKIQNVVAKWSGRIVSDGSLPGTGYEINTAPAGGDLFLKQIRDITDALTEAKASVTGACGYHAHVDTRDLSWRDMRRLALLWEKVEPAMFALQPASRLGSNYCKPCGPKLAGLLRGGTTPEAVRKAIRTGMYGLQGNDGHISKDKYNGLRYDALNIHSWFVRGTVECRIASGTVHYDKLVHWALLVGNIVEWAATHSDDALEALPSPLAPTSGKTRAEQIKVSLGVLTSVTPKAQHAWVAARYKQLHGMSPLATDTLNRNPDADILTAASM